MSTRTVGDERCSYHDDVKAATYCRQCKQLACEECWLEFHPYHDVGGIDDVDDVRAQIADHLEMVNSRLVEFTDAASGLEKEKTAVTECAASAERLVTEAAERLKTAVDRQTIKLHRDLIVAKNRRLADVDQTIEAIKAQLPELQQLHDHLEHCGRRKKLPEMESELSGLHDALRDLQLLHVDRKPLRNRTSFETATVENFLNWNADQLLSDDAEIGEDSEEENDEDDDEASADGDGARMGRQRSREDAAAEGGAWMEASCEDGGEMFRMVLGLKRRLEKERRRNGELRKKLKDTKELLQLKKLQEEKAHAAEITADHVKELEYAIAEVERLVNESERRRTTTAPKDAIPVSIAVIGNSGVGKSSFINAIRRLTADDDGAAAVGVTECTTDIRDYPHPNNPLLKFWDLPGVGTDLFPKDKYLGAVRIDQYDFFLLISATRFTEYDTWLAREINRRGKKYFYIRTKMAVDVANNRRAHPRTHDEQVVISRVLESTQEHLKENGEANVPVLLIDSYRTDRYDFGKLEQMILTDLPEMKRAAMSRYRCVIS